MGKDEGGNFEVGEGGGFAMGTGGCVLGVEDERLLVGEGENCCTSVGVGLGKVEDVGLGAEEGGRDGVLERFVAMWGGAGCFIE